MDALSQTARKRIAFDARYISDGYHGIGRYAFRLLEALVNAAPEHTFAVFRGKNKDSRFNWDTLAARSGVEFHAGPWPLYGPHEQLVWPALLRRARVDVFHSPSFVAPLLASVPTIITVHDLIFDRYPAYMPWSWSRPYYKLLMTLGTRRARRVIAVSEATAADLVLFYQTPPEKIVAITEGADPEFFPTPDGARLQKLRQRYGLTRPFVMAVGTRRPHKNLARLVQAFASLRDSLGHDLVFVGPADPRFPDAARSVAKQEALNDRVHFLDWVAEADLPGLYTLADLVVVPSLAEGFGLPALEAMACGTAVIAANTSSLAEVLGEAGVLVDPRDVDELANAIQVLVRDEALRQRLAQAGLRRAATFNWARVARQVLQLYDQVQVSAQKTEVREPCEGCPEAA